MTKWREIETEGLPKEKDGIEMLWHGPNRNYRIGELRDQFVEWANVCVPVKAFTHWMPLPKLPKKSDPPQAG